MKLKKLVAVCLLGLMSVSALTACNCMKTPDRMERAYPGGK